jgi:enediyne polyketide synthase
MAPWMPEPVAIAIVGMACRFPEAPGIAPYLDLCLAGRRAFRCIPPVRWDAPDPAGAPGQARPGSDPPTTTLGRAALIEGWRFDRAAFGVSSKAYRDTDPAQWLALETAALALADAGFPGGQGLARDRTGVMIGNTLMGDVSRTSTLRARWPYIRWAISTALAESEIPPGTRVSLIERAASTFAAPFPPISELSLPGILPSAIADRICGHFRFRGGGHAVDAAHSSSLLAVASACSALASGELDAVIVGGVDVSLDRYDLTSMAEAGLLADHDMRVYDARPTGFWPGEGCGLVVLMRSADARAAGTPSYAEVAGWGVSSAGSPAPTVPGSAGLLLALRRAYERARWDPAAVHYLEGDGSGNASADLAELTALAQIRAGAPSLAALGSVKANIGHTKAAAGVAGLMKATLVMAAGVIPPSTGCVLPHPLITSGEARVRVPKRAEPWPDGPGPRVAGVSAVGPGGTSVHLVIRRDDDDGRYRRAPRTSASDRHTTGNSGTPATPTPARAPTAPTPMLTTPAPVLPAAAPVLAADSPGKPRAFLFGAADRPSLLRELVRIADLAPWLSDGELGDLAADTARRADGAGPVRAALVAGTQDQLAALARDAVTLVGALPPGRLTTSPGIFAADGGRGRVGLLFPGEGSGNPGDAAGNPTQGAGNGPRHGHAEVASYDPALQPATLAASLADLRWLSELGLDASVGIGHGLGEITGLVWAGCISEAEAARLVSQRAAVLGAPADGRSAMISVDTDARTAHALCAGTELVVAIDNGPRQQVLAGPTAAVRDLARHLAHEGVPARILDAPHGFYSPAMSERAAAMRSAIAGIRFLPPARRLLSSITGSVLTAGDDLHTLLEDQLTSPVRFAGPLRCAAAEVDLLLETGPGDSLSLIAADCSDVPAVSAAGGPAEAGRSRAVAALFAAGAARSFAPLLDGRHFRPIDIWRERVFIVNPCGGPAPAGLLPADRADYPHTATGSGPATATPATAPAPAAAGAMRAPAAPPPVAPATLPVRAQVAPSGTERHLPPRPGGTSRPDSGGNDQAGRAARSAAEPEPLPGVRPWVRVFADALQPAAPAATSGKAGKWRLRAAARQEFGHMAARSLADDPTAAQVLTVVGDPEGPGGCETLLAAGREGAALGGLVVITGTAGLSGFCATLHAENPTMGLTLIQAPATAAGLRWARPYAASSPGTFLEIRIDDTGQAHLPVPVPLDPSGGSAQPGQADVVLVSAFSGVDLAIAGSLVGAGPALAVLAPPGPDDPSVASYLESLRACGVRVSRKKADLRDPGQVATAIRSLERKLGPVSAIVYGASEGPIGRWPSLSGATLARQVAGQRIRLSNVLAALAMERVRLLLTFGSVAGRHGRPDHAPGALLSGLLAAQAARLSSGWPHCRRLHVDWPGWLLPEPGGPAAPGRPGAAGIARPPGAGNSTRPPGITPLPPGSSRDAPHVPLAEGQRLLRAVLACPDSPSRVAIHGRIGTPDTAPTARLTLDQQAPGRFLERVRVHCPGIELIAEADLSLARDPYLADHRIDDIVVLPASMALEAMAQAAQALAGRPMRAVSDFAMPAPVVLPAMADGNVTVLRICALASGDRVEAVLRCRETGFRLDHARAVYRAAAPTPREMPATEPAPGGGAPGIVDGTDLYGTVCFQAGRFRRVAFLPEVSSRYCRALVRGSDDQPWFGSVTPGDAPSPLLLGSPGVNDATAQVLQACLPDRRTLLSACESVSFSGSQARGALHVHAARRLDNGSWDVGVRDAAGRAVADWRGIRLRDLGPLPRTAPWHPALLAVSLEARAAELGLDPDLRAAIVTGRSPARVGAGPAAGRSANPGRSGLPVPVMEALPGPGAGQPAQGQAWAARAAGLGPLAGFELNVVATRPVSCAWEAVGPAEQTAGGSDPAIIGLKRHLAARSLESSAALTARLHALVSCLASLGSDDGDPLVLHGTYDGGWVLVRSRAIAAGCVVTELAGVAGLIAVCLACRAPAGAEGVSSR